jgi:hypothetical protein
MRSPRESLRSFKEGLQPKLLWDYWLAFKVTVWEMLWGATAIGIPFAIYAYFRGPSKVLFLSCLVLVVFTSGYYLWRADHVRLIPKFEVKDFVVVQTPTSLQSEQRVYVQIRPRCLTDTPISNCEGRLLRVLKRANATEEWSPTAMDEPINMEWSIHGCRPVTMYPGAEPRINVCYVALSTQRTRLRQIVPTVCVSLFRCESVFDSDGEFRFDIRITAENCAPVDVSLAVSVEPARPSTEPTVSMV